MLVERLLVLGAASALDTRLLSASVSGSIFRIYSPKFEAQRFLLTQVRPGQVVVEALGVSARGMEDFKVVFIQFRIVAESLQYVAW